MKKTYVLIILLSLVLKSCYSQNNSNQSFSNEELKLVEFMDSIGKLNPKIWEEKVAHNSDSVYESQIQMDVQISDDDFEKLKEQAETSRIDINLFKRIFPDEIIDTMDIYNDSLFIVNYHFSENKFDHFAIQIFRVGWDANVYFFNKNRIVAKHHIFHRYGLEIEFFQNEKDETVIYYEQNFASGTDIFWNNYNFFKYSENSLIPVLNELSQTNQRKSFGGKSIQFSTEVLSTNPIKINMFYNQYFDDSLDNTINLVNDSIEVIYKWSDVSKQYIPDFKNSKLNKHKILSYYLDNGEYLFINTHYDELVEIVKGKNKIKKQFVFEYLNELKTNTKK